MFQFFHDYTQHNLWHQQQSLQVYFYILKLCYYCIRGLLVLSVWWEYVCSTLVVITYIHKRIGWNRIAHQNRILCMRLMATLERITVNTIENKLYYSKFHPNAEDIMILRWSALCSWLIFISQTKNIYRAFR